MYPALFPPYQINKWNELRAVIHTQIDDARVNIGVSEYTYS